MGLNVDIKVRNTDSGKGANLMGIVFDIKVEDEELIPENLDSIANVIDYVLRKRGTISA